MTCGTVPPDRRHRSWRAPGATGLAGSLLGALLTSALACKTAPPPPPPVVPPPTPEVPQVVPTPPPPPLFVRVTGSRLNVREAPGTDRRTVAKVKKGERLEVIAEEGKWLQVKFGKDKTGWVHSDYVARQAPDAPCLADKSEAELLTEPTLSFSSGPTLGKVVIEASVDSHGEVVATKLVENSTGDPGLAQFAEGEVRKLRFSPPIQQCRPVPFTYVYTRAF